MPYKVKINRSLCIGAGSCETLAPKVFGLDAGGKVILKEKTGFVVQEANFSDLDESSEHIWNAAKACPVNAIVIIEVDEKGNEIKQVWPA